jgi:hypothetical protein
MKEVHTQAIYVQVIQYFIKHDSILRESDILPKLFQRKGPSGIISQA